MPTLTDIRRQYPQYNDLSDTELADALHRKYYSDLPKANVYSTLGIGEDEPTPTPTPTPPATETRNDAPVEGQDGLDYLLGNPATLPARQDPGALADIGNYMGSSIGAQAAGLGRGLEDAPRIARAQLADPMGMFSAFGGTAGTILPALARAGIEYAYDAIAPNADEEYRAAIAPVSNPLIEAGERTQQLYTPYTGTPSREYSAAREEGEGVPYALWRGARAALIGGAGSAPTIAAGLVAGRLAGPRAAAGVMGGQSTAAAYEGIRQTQEREGIDDPNRAFSAALASGLLDASTGLGGRTIATATQAALRKGVERGLSGVMREVGRTGLSEAGTEVVQNLIEQVGGGQNPLTEESLLQSLDAGLTGFAGGVVLGTPVEGLNRRNDADMRRAFGAQPKLQTIEVNVPGDGGRSVPTTLDILSAPDANGNVRVRTAEGTPYVDSLANIEAMRPAPTQGETRENLTDVLTEAAMQNADDAALSAAVNVLMNDPADGSARALLRARLRNHGIPDHIADQLVDQSLQTAAASAPQTGQEAAATSVVNSINRAAKGKNKAVKAGQEQAIVEAKEEVAAAPAQPKRRTKKTQEATTTAPLSDQRFSPLANNEATTRFPKTEAPRNAFFNGAMGTSPIDFFTGRKTKMTKAEVTAFNAGRAWGAEQGRTVSAEELTLKRPAPVTTEGEPSALEAGLGRLAQPPQADQDVGAELGGAEPGVPSAVGKQRGKRAAATTTGAGPAGVDTTGGAAGVPVGGEQPSQPPVTKVAPGDARGTRETRTGMMGAQRGRPVTGAAALTEGMRAEQELYAELEAARKRGEISDEEVAQALNTLRPPTDREGNFDNKAFKELPANERSAWGSAIAAQQVVDDQAAVVSAIPKEVLGQPNPERTDAEVELAKRQRTLDDAQRNLVGLARNKVQQKATERSEAQAAIRELLKDPNLTDQQRRDLQTQLRENVVDRKYRRKGEGAAVGVAKEKVEAHIAKLASGLRAQLDVTVVGSFEELPDYVRSALERDNALDAQGTILPGMGIYILAYNLDSLPDATATFYHEVLGHMGLSALFGHRLDRALQIVYDSNKTLREETDQWLKDRPGAYTNTPNRKLRALEEILANRSEGGVLKASVWDKIVGVFKDFGRRMGMQLEYSNTEVRNLLAKAHDQMVRGPRRSNAMQGLRYVEKNMTPGSRFSGKLRLRHSSSDPNLQLTAPEELASESRYDGGAGSVFGDSGMYMADPTDTKWPELLYWANKTYDVDASFDNAFVVTPDTLAEFISLVQPDMNGSQVPYFNTAERLRELGYDGLILRDMDEMGEEYDDILGKNLSLVEDEADRLGIPIGSAPGYIEAKQAALREWGERYGLSIPATAADHIATNLQDQIVAFYPERQVEIQSQPYSAYVQKYAAKKATPSGKPAAAKKTKAKTPAEEAAEAEAKAQAKTRKGVEKVQRSLEAGGLRDPDAVAENMTDATKGASEFFRQKIDELIEPLEGIRRGARRWVKPTDALIMGLRRGAPDTAAIAEQMREVLGRMQALQSSMSKAMGTIGRGLNTFLRSNADANYRIANTMHLTRTFSFDPTLYKDRASALANDRLSVDLRKKLVDLRKKIKAEKDAEAKKKLSDALKKADGNLRKRQSAIEAVWDSWEKLGKLEGGHYQYRQQKQFFEDMHTAMVAVLDSNIDILNVPQQQKDKLKESRKVDPEELTDSDHEYPGVKVSLLDDVYFPFLRFGDFVMTAKWKGRNGRRARWHFDTNAERKAYERKFREEYAKEIADGAVAIEFMNAADAMAQDVQESTFLRDVFAAIEKPTPKGATEEQSAAFKKQIKDRIYQVYLMTLPERSIRKQFIHAKLVEGQSPDIGRVFADTARRYASQMPKMTAKPQLDRLIKEGEKSLESTKADSPAEKEKMTQLFNLISGRSMQEFENQEISGVQKAINLTAFGLLMTGALSTFVQTIAFPQQAMPRMLTMYPKEAAPVIANYLRVFGELPNLVFEFDPVTGERMVAMPSFGNTKFIKNNKLRQRLFKEMEERGFFAQHQTDMMLRGMAEPAPGVLGGAANAYEGAVRAMGVPLTSMDQLTREMTALMFAEMAYNKTKDVDKAVKLAMQNTDDTLGNYSDLEQPGIFRGNGGRFLRFLRTYSVQRAKYYGRMLLTSVIGSPYQTRKQAISELVMVGFVTTMFGGIGSNFLYSTFTTLAEALFSLLMDDEEEEEFRRENPLAFGGTMTSAVTRTEFNANKYLMYSLLPRAFGEDTGMTRGLQRGFASDLLNVDLSSRVSQDDLFIRDWQSGDDLAETTLNFLGANLAPQLSAGLGIAKGFDALARGDFQRAVKGLTPAMFRGSVLAADYREEGIQSTSGDPILPAEYFDGVSTGEARGLMDDLTTVAIGGQPFDVATMYESKLNRLYDLRKGTKERQDNLMAEMRMELQRRNINQEHVADIVERMLEFNRTLPPDLHYSNFIDLPRVLDSMERAARDPSYYGTTVTKDEIILLMREEGVLSDEEADALSTAYAMERLEGQ